jgi:transcriptional regulator with XRE-family HTH domain
MRSSQYRRSPTNKKKLLKQIIDVMVKSLDKTGMYINRNTYYLISKIAGISFAYIWYTLHGYPSYTFNKLRSITNSLNDEITSFVESQSKITESKLDEIKSCVTGKAIKWSFYPSERKQDYNYLTDVLQTNTIRGTEKIDEIKDYLNYISENLMTIFFEKILNTSVYKKDSIPIGMDIVEHKPITGSYQFHPSSKDIMGTSVSLEKFHNLNYEIQPYIKRDINVDEYVSKLPETTCGLLFKHHNEEINTRFIQSTEIIAQRISHELESFKFRIEEDYETVKLTIYITMILFLIIFANKIYYTFRTRCSRRCDGKRKSRKSRKRRKSRKSRKRRSHKRSIKK